MELVAVVIAAALVEYFVFSALVGRERTRRGIEAPAVTGDPIFERYVRVHLNTMEQLVIFIPAIGLFAIYTSAGLAALLGIVFIVARVLYLRGYVEDPKKRGTGAVITAVVQVILMLGAGGGALVAWLR